MDESLHSEGGAENIIEHPEIIRWVVTVETDGVAVEREFTDDVEANAYLATESENPNATCSIREETEAVTTE